MKHKLSLLHSTAFSALTSLGQTPVYQGTAMLSATGPGSRIEILDAITDEHGNSYVTGYFVGSVDLGSTTLVSSGYGGQNAFIAKLSTTSTWVWANRLGGSSGGSGGTSGHAISIDGTGGLYVVASVEQEGLSYGSVPVSVSYANSLCIISLDTAGVFQSIIDSDACSTNGVRLIVDPSGNAYMALIRNPGEDFIHFGSITLPCGGDMDLVFAKATASGSWEWAKGFTAGEMVLNGLAFSQTGDIIVGGIIHGPGQTFDGVTVTSNPHNDPGIHLIPFVGKWSTSGTLQWLRSMENTHSGGFEIESLVVDPDDNIVVLGVATDTVELGALPQVIGNLNAPLQTMAVLNSNGDWINTMTSTQFGGWITDMALLPDASLACVGLYYSTTEFGSETIQCAGNNDAFAALMRPTVQWSGGVGAGGPSYEDPHRINITGSAIRVFGAFDDVAVFGDDTLTCPSVYCTFISTLEISTVGVQEPPGTTSVGFDVFPVPVTDQLTLNASHELIGQAFNIYDFQGRLIANGKIHDTANSVNTGQLLPGNYILRSGPFAARFIKE